MRMECARRKKSSKQCGVDVLRSCLAECAARFELREMTPGSDSRRGCPLVRIIAYARSLLCQRELP
jgi:hypothetical protein